ncbi:hypothetical protein H6763_01020 [Candidatus Nomurabacteria bacterium]|uniref:Uncharacterized protein n=1 Tax=Candidatus Dojkabacteria bacterium TaxID=2099670 RepID=A0A955I1Z1_9BACT|nr:hypothetical protein [Candidatus Dojkabacteria bacterium]MCB9790023.1 hypothetical protein [Candidatus Nomurabacteria bacterium]MCB9803390.1 hypothetical protein [Candidatus Nomurabacteria bacterium]
MKKDDKLERYLGATIVLTKGVKEYRQTIDRFVNMQDSVLEIGFAWGTTTDLLSKVASKVVGIDKGLSYRTAIKDHPQLELYQLDAFEIKKVIDLGYSFSVIYIDVSGCRSMFDIITLIKMYENAFRPGVIVVKATKLKGFVRRCIVWDSSSNR